MVVLCCWEVLFCCLILFSRCSRRSRIFCWLVYDLVAVGIVTAVVILAVATESSYGSTGGNTTSFVSSNPLYTPEQHIPRDLAEVLYWCRVLYGWLCFPWILLLLPGMFPLLVRVLWCGRSCWWWCCWWFCFVLFLIFFRVVLSTPLTDAYKTNGVQ